MLSKILTHIRNIIIEYLKRFKMLLTYNNFCEKITLYANIRLCTRIYDQTISLDFNKF